MSGVDLGAIRADIEMAKRSAEMARHVALDHGPELLAEVRRLQLENEALHHNVCCETCMEARAEVEQLRSRARKDDRVIRALRRQRAERLDALAAIERVRALADKLAADDSPVSPVAHAFAEAIRRALHNEDES